MLGKVIDLLILQHVFFSPFQNIPRIMQGIRFDDLQSAVAYRGIKEAFPYATIYNGSIGQNSPGPNQKHAL